MSSDVAKPAKTAKLILDGKEYELPIVVGSEGELAVDITQLRDKTGYITLDDGYRNTGSAQSAITFIDGEKRHPAVPRHSHRAVGRIIRRSSKPPCC